MALVRFEPAAKPGFRLQNWQATGVPGVLKVGEGRPPIASPPHGDAGATTVNYIAKWDGLGWSSSANGTNGTVHAMQVHDDGSGGGPALYAGGDFWTAGAVSAKRIAKWDGAMWSAIGAGSGGTGMNSQSLAPSLGFALAVFDDGGGEALYAGGDFELSASGGQLPRQVGLPSASDLILHREDGDLLRSSQYQRDRHTEHNGHEWIRHQITARWWLSCRAAQTTPAGFLGNMGTTVNAQTWGRDSVLTGQVLSDGISWASGP